MLNGGGGVAAAIRFRCVEPALPVQAGGGVGEGNGTLALQLSVAVGGAGVGREVESPHCKLVRRSGDDRRRRVHEGDVLDRGGGVAASISGFPGAVDAGFAGAVGRCARVCVGNRDIGAASVGGGGSAGVGRQSGIATLQLLVGRAGDNGRGSILDGDGLDTRAVLPLESVAFQVRVMVCGQLPEVASVKETCGLESQVSVAVAMPVLLGVVGWPHSTVTSAGQEIAGAVVSWTITENVQEFVLPLRSVARAKMVLTPTRLPLVGVRVNFTPGELSETIGSSKKTGPSVHSTNWLVGQMIEGGSQSATITAT